MPVSKSLIMFSEDFGKKKPSELDHSSWEGGIRKAIPCHAPPSYHDHNDIEQRKMSDEMGFIF